MTRQWVCGSRKGRYELSFNGFRSGTGFRRRGLGSLRFRRRRPRPQDYTSVSPAGTEVSIQGNDYSVKVDFDQRTQYYIDNFGSIYADEAFSSLCHDNACVFPNWYFAIDGGGWIDNLQLSYLELSHLGTTQGSSHTRTWNSRDLSGRARCRRNSQSWFD